MAMTAKQVRQALTRLKRVRASRSSIAVLATIRIDADGLHATDMDARLTIRADTGLADPAQVCPMQLASALKGCKPSDVVTFERVDGFGVRVNGVTLQGVDPADWPEHVESVPDLVRMPAGMFDAMRDVADAAVSRDDSRPVLTGVHVARRQDSVSVTATDSYRLARVLLHGGEVFADDLEVILPVNGGKYLAGIGAAHSMAVGEVLVRFDSDDATLMLSRIEGLYPNADQLIPQSSVFEHRGMTTGMLAPVERIAGMSRKGTPLVLRIDGGASRIGYSSDESMVEPVEVSSDWDSCDSLTIGLNPSFLRDGLRFVGDAESFGMISPLRPVLMGDPYDRCYLLMPVRLNDAATRCFDAPASVVA